LEDVRKSKNGFLNPEHGTDRLSRNVGKKLPYSLRNNPEESSSQQFRGGSVKSRTQEVFSVEEVVIWSMYVAINQMRF